ncbi:DUF881 domain-containing protein [Nocardioides sp. LS1]|uniref:DUF881 domain-containing protein n=1 Tax=Nocardioides sp. LS1 TaxID=1027620 RepID=UPI0021AB2D59|nr:DUF881 domain-containing protein [Nocardioides sp. LS1]
MTPGSHARPAVEEQPRLSRLRTLARATPLARLRRSRPPRSSWPWRVGTPVVVLLCGGLFIVSAHNSHGTDLRPGRYTDLASLVQGESDQYDALKQRVAQLNDDVQRLTNSVNDSDVRRFQRKIEKLKDPAGLVAHTGPGVTVTLADAPADVQNGSDVDPNRLVVHQQDIQAVVNAMWVGGATAVTINGQRVVSTTGIKCEGNAVQLQGVPYSQPYVISAVGDQGSILSAIDRDDYLGYYRDDAANPLIQVGWDVQTEDSLTAPAYDGLLDLNYAKPLTS